MKNIEKRAAEIQAKVEEIKHLHPDKTEGQIRIIAIRELAKK